MSLTGTDSRIGFGYRLGDHADFQVQFEIGPQKDTQAIGTGSTNKRATSSSDSYKAEREANREAYKEKVKRFLFFASIITMRNELCF